MKLSPETQAKLEGERAEEEAVALLEIVHTLKPFEKCDRRRIIETVSLLLDAEEQMAGVMSAFLAGLKSELEKS